MNNNDTFGKTIYYYFHAGSKNHGCEAIVRSTTQLLNVRPRLISMAPEEDEEYGIDQIVDLSGNKSYELSLGEKAYGYLASKLLHNEKIGYEIKAKHESEIFDPGAIAMSIGGDNYCYGVAYNLHLAGLNRQLHKRGVKTVLWGCSIESSEVTDKMIKDFKTYDLIVARESISHDFLKRHNPNTLLACDPAFLLRKREMPLPEYFLEGHTVGINISPLIQNKERIPGITLQNYRNLIQYILKETDYNIALIPHVICDGNDDRVPAYQLYREFSHSKRICVIPDGNCEELKGYISRCELFVGARTHATIAAYASYIPTLVVGYSTKAKGIAKDLFGTDQKYVLPVQELVDEHDLTTAFRWLADKKDSIHTHLENTIPTYVQSISNAKSALWAL